MFSERFKEFRKSLGFTQVQIAQCLGCTQAAVSDYEKGRREPSFDVIRNIAIQYKSVIPWLLTGHGEMFDKPAEPKPVTQITEATYDRKTGKVSTLYNNLLKCSTFPVTLGGEIAAGEPAECLPDPDAEPLAIPNVLMRDRAENYVVLRVSGNSMEPNIQSGDLVLIHETTNWVKASGRIAAVMFDGEITLKEVQIDTRLRVTHLIPHNHAHKFITIYEDDERDIKLIGIMEALIRMY